MIEVFISWIEARKARMLEQGITVSTRRDKKQEHLDFYTAAIAEVESDKLTGTVIYYHSGDLDVDFFSRNETDSVAFIETHSPANEYELVKIIQETFDKISAF
jgi:hypothetical protein